MFSSEARHDRKIEALEKNQWVEISPKDLKEGHIIRMWGLFIDENGNSVFKVTSSVYDKNGFKNVDAEPIDLNKEMGNGQEHET